MLDGSALVSRYLKEGLTLSVFFDLSPVRMLKRLSALLPPLKNILKSLTALMTKRISFTSSRLEIEVLVLKLNVCHRWLFYKVGKVRMREETISL